MKRHALLFLLAAALVLPSFAQAPKKPAEAKPAEAKPAEPAAPNKELTRAEIAKLGGFQSDPANPVDEGPMNLNFDVLMVTLPDALAMPLAESFRDPVKSGAAIQKLMALIEAKKAQVTAWPRVQVKPGTHAVAENIQEVKYAIEFVNDPPAVAAAAAAPAPVEKAPPGPVVPAAIGVLPTTFETRNVGATLEVEPTLGPDGKTMEIYLVARYVRLLAWDNIKVQQNGATTVSMPQPRFQDHKVSQTLSIRPGERLLVGTFRRDETEDQMEFFILGASVSRAEEKTKEKKR